MPTTVSEQALQLTDEALREFDSVPLSATVRRSIRIARLRGDWIGVWWLDMESIQVAKRDSMARKIEMAGHFAEDELDRVHEAVVQEFTHERRIARLNDDGSLGNEDKVCSYSVEEIENRMVSLARQFELAANDPEQRARGNHYGLETLREQFADVMGRIRRRVWDYLIRTEIELRFGQSAADLFDAYRREVDSHIGLIQPEILDQFQSAYRRAAEGGPEERAQAVTSCRRILKALADAVYPPSTTAVRGSDGNERVLTDQMWVSRLWQFVAEKQASSRSRQLLQATVEELGHRVDALNDLTSKGLHDETTEQEVRQAVIQTYVTVGDILRLHDETTANPAELPSS